MPSEGKGSLYPSKAIVGVAYSFKNPGEGVVPSSTFSGGVSTESSPLAARPLGFELVPTTTR